MTFGEWLTANPMRMPDVASAIGVHLVTAYKLRNGIIMPSIRIAAAIERLTAGQVTALDFVPNPPGRPLCATAEAMAKTS